MPYLNKVRGTRKSIDAILNIYGIPSTILEVHEYGGYNSNFTQSYVNSVYDYYLNFDSSSQYINIPESIVSSSVDGDYTIEMMFKPDQALTGSYLVSSADTTSSIQTSQNVLTASYGNITYSNISSSLAFDNDFELFNTNYWYHLIYQVSGSDTVNMYAKVFDDSIMEIDESVSAPLTESSFPSEALNMFSDYLGGAKEIRF